MQRWLVIVGVMCVLLGVSYPWWSRAITVLWGLPGNIVIRRGHFQLYFPLTLCVIASVVLTLVSWLSRR